MDGASACTDCFPGYDLHNQICKQRQGCVASVKELSKQSVWAMVECLDAWIVGWPAACLLACLPAGWLAGLLACLPACLLACFLASLLPCFLASLLPCFPAALLPCFLASLLPWLVGWCGCMCQDWTCHKLMHTLYIYIYIDTYTKTYVVGSMYWACSLSWNPLQSTCWKVYVAGSVPLLALCP